MQQKQVKYKLEAKLSGLRKELQEIFGMEVDISIIKQGGAFDNPPFIPFEQEINNVQRFIL